jgi:hypothetical protein
MLNGMVGVQEIQELIIDIIGFEPFGTQAFVARSASFLCPV